MILKYEFYRVGSWKESVIFGDDMKVVEMLGIWIAGTMV